MLYTTFSLAHKAGACTSRYEFFARKVGGVNKYGAETPIPLSDILEICGMNDTLWVLGHCTIDADTALKLLRVFACDCAEYVLPIYERKYPGDSRVRDCIAATRKFLEGKITPKELQKARATAYAAADAADANAYAAAAYATAAAAYATAAAAYAYAAYYAAVSAAAYAANAAAADATNAANATVYTDAKAAMRKWQVGRLRELLTNACVLCDPTEYQHRQEIFRRIEEAHKSQKKKQ